MKSLSFFVVALSVALFAGSGVANAQSDEAIFALAGAEFQPRWTASAGTIILHRSNARSALLAEDGTTHEELANTADFDLGWAAGSDVQVNRHFENGWSFGVRYFMVDEWKATKSLSDPGNILVPLVSTDPDDYFDTASALYASRLYSTELNLGRQIGERLRILAGFRWVELHERIGADAWSPTLEGTFDFDNSNHLYGFQLGAEGKLLQRGALEVDGFVKAGIYGNAIRLNVAGEGTYFEMDETATASRTSFLGEIGLTAKYRLGQHWSVYGGYEVMWLEGVVLAGDAVAALDAGSSDMLLNGTAFYHGAVAGVEFRW